VRLLNLGRTQSAKAENQFVATIIPGPKAPKSYVPYLSPLKAHLDAAALAGGIRLPTLGSAAAAAAAAVGGAAPGASELMCAPFVLATGTFDGPARNCMCGQTGKGYHACFLCRCAAARGFGYNKQGDWVAGKGQLLVQGYASLEEDESTDQSSTSGDAIRHIAAGDRLHYRNSETQADRDSGDSDSDPPPLILPRAYRWKRRTKDSLLRDAAEADDLKKSALAGHGTAKAYKDFKTDSGVSGLGAAILCFDHWDAILSPGVDLFHTLFECVIKSIWKMIIGDPVPASRPWWVMAGKHRLQLSALIANVVPPSGGAFPHRPRDPVTYFGSMTGEDWILWTWCYSHLADEFLDAKMLAIWEHIRTAAMLLLAESLTWAGVDRIEAALRAAASLLQKSDIPPKGARIFTISFHLIVVHARELMVGTGSLRQSWQFWVSPSVACLA
jgi:hypothetical protein